MAFVHFSKYVPGAWSLFMNPIEISFFHISFPRILISALDLFIVTPLLVHFKSCFGTSVSCQEIDGDSQQTYSIKMIQIRPARALDLQRILLQSIILKGSSIPPSIMTFVPKSFKSKLIGLKRNEKQDSQLFVANSQPKKVVGFTITVLPPKNLAYRFTVETFRYWGIKEFKRSKESAQNYFWNWLRSHTAIWLIIRWSRIDKLQTKEATFSSEIEFKKWPLQGK